MKEKEKNYQSNVEQAVDTIDTIQEKVQKTDKKRLDIKKGTIGIVALASVIGFVLPLVLMMVIFVLLIIGLVHETTFYTTSKIFFPIMIISGIFVFGVVPFAENKKPVSLLIIIIGVSFLLFMVMDSVSKKGGHIDIFGIVGLISFFMFCLGMLILFFPKLLASMGTGRFWGITAILIIIVSRAVAKTFPTFSYVIVYVAGFCGAMAILMLLRGKWLHKG
jgi:hypothetical protein